MMHHASEQERLSEAYEHYYRARKAGSWSLDNPGNRMIARERREVLRRMLAEAGRWPPTGLDVLDIGCGGGEEIA